MHNFRSKRFFSNFCLSLFRNSINRTLSYWGGQTGIFFSCTSLIMITPKIYFLQYKEKPLFKSLRKLNERRKWVSRLKLSLERNFFLRLVRPFFVLITSPVQGGKLLLYPSFVLFRNCITYVNTWYFLTPLLQKLCA